MLELKKYTYAPVHLDVAEITDENMEEVADWCEGKVCKDETGENVRYIRVPVVSPHNSRQTMGFVGDRVLKTKGGFKVYTPKAFERAFVAVN